MTAGNILFYSGVGLFALTVILAIVFLIKKPEYEPEKAAYDGRGGRKTQSLRSGYPTDRLTARFEKTSPDGSRQGTVTQDGSARRTEAMAGGQPGRTEPMSGEWSGKTEAMTAQSSGGRTEQMETERL